MLILILFIVGLFYLYKFSTKNYDYFEKPAHKLKYAKPYPFVGSGFSAFFIKQPMIKLMEKNYLQYRNEKLYGFFTFSKPGVVVVDPKIAKQLVVREFEHFTDHQGFQGADPLLDKTLVALNGEKWKNMRTTLSPAFTGSKMRLMFDFLVDISEDYIKTMTDKIKSTGNIDFEFGDLSTKFTVDMIASCAFGIEINSFANPENEFFKIAKKITTQSMNFGQIIKMLGFMVVPKLMRLLKFEFFDPNINYLIREMTLNTMKVREEKGIIRHDMIHLLMQAKKGQLDTNNNVEEKITEGFATVDEDKNINFSAMKTVWDDDDLAAQCLIFFFAGFSTVSQTLSFMSYEITCNPQIQQKLYEEILDMENDLNGKRLTYEKLQGMKYLDQVVCETLRHWPIAVLTERQCVKDYDLKMDDGSTYHFDKGVSINMPVYNFHHDPRYFDEPDKFDPERFNDENRKNIDADTYMPFGIGPRNCIGSRFALMKMKTILYHILLNFSFEVTEKTDIPFKFEDTPFAQRPANGFWIGLKPRK